MAYTKGYHVFVRQNKCEHMIFVHIMQYFLVKDHVRLLSYLPSAGLNHEPNPKLLS